MRFLLRVALNAVAVMLAAQVVPGVYVSSGAAAVLAALVLGIVNAVIRPILIVLTLPFTILTLGLFIFVVNAICLGLVAWIVPGFGVRGLGSALLGSIFISLVSWVLSALLIDKPHS